MLFRSVFNKVPAAGNWPVPGDSSKKRATCRNIVTAPRVRALICRKKNPFHSQSFQIVPNRPALERRRRVFGRLCGMAWPVSAPYRCAARAQATLQCARMGCAARTAAPVLHVSQLQGRQLRNTLHQTTKCEAPDNSTCATRAICAFRHTRRGIS